MLQFVDRENDATGLYYYRNRYYSPSLRCFISRDPLREAAGENEYSYVGNNPLSLTDPLGLQEGPVNYLRDPFPPEYWVANAASNTVSDLLFLDTIAAAGWTLGNWCRPLSERLWAGGKIVIVGVFAVLGGAILGKALGWLGRAIAPLFKRIPMGPLSKAASKANCFVVGTLIHTAEGLKPIEEIKAGDMVLSYNEQTKKTEYQLVVRTFVNQSEELLEIKVAGEDEPLVTTLGHPFYVQRARSNTSGEIDDSGGSDEGEWLLSKLLRAGDKLLKPSGESVQIVSIKQFTQSQPIYNFEVAENHNYFVGQQGLLVHNDSLTQRLRNGEDVIVNSLDDARQLLKQFPELKPGNRSTCINSYLPGPDARGTYRGDLMYAYKTENGILTKAENFIHPSNHAPPLHSANPHYNLYFRDGTKAAIIIKPY